MILNDWQRGKIPFFVPPPGCEMAPPPAEAQDSEGTEKPAMEQDFSQIRVSHKFDGDDTAGGLDDTAGSLDDTLPTDISQVDDSVVDASHNSEPEESGPDEAGEEEERASAKKRKPSKETKSSKKVKTASGIFVVSDVK
jgi:nuclear GTP-binding protein